MTFEENMDDILSDMEDMEDMETDEKKQHERQHQVGKGDRGMIEKDERQYWGGKKLIECPSDRVGKKKKRKPSEYNIFIGKCMHGGKDMKTCAAEYKEEKKTIRHKPAGIDAGMTADIRKTEIEVDEKIKDGQVFLVTTEYCPACDDLKNKKYVKKEIERGNIIIVDDGNELREEIDRTVDIVGYPAFAVYFENEGFVDSETAKTIAIERERKDQEKRGKR